jgi:hypothetical protein
MASRLTTLPGPQALAEALSALLGEFNPKTTSFPDRTGQWREAPPTLQDRIVHELLFQLTRLNPEALSELQAQAFAPFLSLEAWPGILTLAQTSPPQSAGLGLVRGLARLLQAETLRFQSEQPVAPWNSEKQKRRQETMIRLSHEEADLDRLLGQETRQRLLDLLGRAGPDASSFFGSIIRLAAEEDALFDELKILRGRLLEPAGGEEAAACLLEKIQPPLGIVTNTSPALVLPCLSLLADTELRLESGIPYAASVILSILRDARSSWGLLRALERLPLSCSKLRENIIYTLGCLREEKAIPLLVAVLGEADEVPARPLSAEARVRSLVEQKVEAVWALGKIGPASFSAIPVLARYADHPSAPLRTTLAWTLGEIGRAQKEKLGGLDADLVIALLKLLKTKNRQVSEEAVGALRRIDLPEFVHSLYLYQAGAVSLQSLLPAQRGLYELSETLHYLIQTKGRVIMAVNGDSGTGKTFFCQAIAGGFGDLKPQDILYLMRDRKSGQKVFNRILGLRWLKKNIDPAYYYDYPLSAEEDDPQAFFEQFSLDNKSKKLIIFDGCRDKFYFQRVIDFFYQKGALDVEVTFRAAFSTRRLNLEEREMALESVKTHLSFVEEPVLEDTPFYREGIVLLYDLDNSVGSRLDRDETQELFARQKIDSWGDFIRLGSFEKEKKTGAVRAASLDVRTETRTLENAEWAAGQAQGFRPEERHIRTRLNDDAEAEPNLLQTFDLEDLAADRLRFYAQNQVAGTAEDGHVFVLSFIDNRLFQTRLDKIEGLTLMGRELYTLTPDGGLLEVSFERNEIALLGRRPAAACTLASFGREQLFTGHEDGTVCIWDLAEKRSRLIRAGRQSIVAAAADQRGRFCAGTSDGCFLRLDPNSGRTEILEFPGRTVALIKPYLRDKVLLVTRPRQGAAGEPDSLIHILDLENRTSSIISLPEGGCISSVNVYFDGRLIAGLSQPRKPAGFPGPNLLIIEVEQETFTASGLAGQARGVKDCLTMGPRIISCGREEGGQSTLRMWGTEFYVQTELSKLAVRSVWPQ